MSYFTYDTSVIISKKLDDLPDRTSSFLSAVVLMELSASAKDQKQRKIYERLFQTYGDDNTLIGPNRMTGCLRAKCFTGWLKREGKVAEESSQNCSQVILNEWRSTPSSQLVLAGGRQLLSLRIRVTSNRSSASAMSKSSKPHISSRIDWFLPHSQPSTCETGTT